jgi:hypothetical protein
MKKIKKEISKYVQDKREESYQEGYYDASLESDIKYLQGARRERKRIMDLFKMLSAQELENGSATKAKHYYDVSAIIGIADDFEIYDEEGNLVKDVDDEDF